MRPLSRHCTNREFVTKLQVKGGGRVHIAYMGPRRKQHAYVMPCGWVVGRQEDDELLGLARRMLSEEAVRCAIAVMRVSEQAGRPPG